MGSTGPTEGAIPALSVGTDKITKTSITKHVVGVQAGVPTAIFPNTSETTEPFLSKEVILTSELSAFGAYFVVTLILYVCTTIKTLNQLRIFMKFNRERNFKFSPMNDTVGAPNMGTLQPQLGSFNLPRKISNHCIHL